jgi:hypothetical protein
MVRAQKSCESHPSCRAGFTPGVGAATTKAADYFAGAASLMWTSNVA